MNKSELLDAIADQTGQTKTDISQTLENRALLADCQRIKWEGRKDALLFKYLKPFFLLPVPYGTPHRQDQNLTGLR